MNPKVILAGVAVLVLAGCASTTLSQVPSTPSSTSTHTTAPSTPTTAPLTGPVGTTYQGTASDGSTYKVTLDKVLEPAAPASEFDAAASGHHLAGVQFTVVGVKGNTDENVNLDAKVVGSDGQLYSASIASRLAVGTNFDYGSIKVSPGEKLTGWAAFELPNGVTVKSVQWSPFLSSEHATWTIGK